MVLETDGFEDIYLPLRDQRNAEIIQGLTNLRENIKELTGPQILHGLTCFALDFYLTGKILNPVYDFFLFSNSAALAENCIKTEMQAASAAKKATSAGACTELEKAAQKIETAVQETVAKKTAQKLSNAEKHFNKSAKSGLGDSSEIIRNQAHNVNAQAALDKKLRALKKAQEEAKIIKNLPDGRIRYYSKESPSKTYGPTRGSSYVTEYNPIKGRVRSWQECYDHNGKINRVHPKTIDGFDVTGQHYPPIKAEVELFSKNKKG